MIAALPPLLDRLDRAASRPPVRTAALLAALAAVYLQAHFFWLSESREVDSYSYWFAARAVAEGRDPYDTAALQAKARGYDLRLVAGDAPAPDVYAYVYPPPFAGAWRALTFLSPTRAHRLLEWTGTLLLGAALLLLHRFVSPARHGGLLFLAFALGLAVNGPAVSSTRLGQMNAPLLAAMLFAADGYRRGGGLAPATSLAAATLVKLTPAALLLGWALGDRGPRLRAFALRTALAIAALVLVSLPFAPWVHWEQFFAALGRGSPWQSPYSWWGWLTLKGQAVPAIQAARGVLYLAGAAALLVLAARHLRRVAREDVPVEGAAVAVVLGLLLSPLTWQHHFLFFLLPAYAWLARAWAERRVALALAFAACAALVLLRLPGAWLMVRPLATLAAFVFATLSSRPAGRPAAAAMGAP